MIVKNIRKKQHIIRFQSKQRQIQQINFLIHFAIHNEIKKSSLKIDNSKIYFMYFKIHENFEHDKNFSIKKFIDLFTCENQQLN